MPRGSRFQMWLSWMPLTPPETAGKLSTRAAVSQGFTGLEITGKLSREAAVRLHASAHTFQPVCICRSPVTNTTGWHLKRWTFVVLPC